MSLRDHSEELRRQYAEMPDQQLRALTRDDLSDLARRCYDAEMARRELQPHTPEPPPPQAEGLVAIATFVYPDDAKLARALLESASIPTYLGNEHTLAADWFLTNVIGGLKLMVPAPFVAEATEILRSRVSDEDLDAQAEAAKPPRPYPHDLS